MNNLVLRRLRYALNLREAGIAEIFKLVNVEVKLKHISDLLKREEDEGFAPCSGAELEQFLNGLIIKLRGVREGAPAPQPVSGEAQMNNNITLKKIRIALELREEHLMEIMELADFKFSKSEMSAFFRKPGSRQYKPCGDQMLRNFLIGLCKKMRPGDIKES